MRFPDFKSEKNTVSALSVIVLNLEPPIFNNTTYYTLFHPQNYSSLKMTDRPSTTKAYRRANANIPSVEEIAIAGLGATIPVGDARSPRHP